MLWPHDDGGSAVTSSRFGELFARSIDVYDAIRAVMGASREGAEAVDAAAVVRELMAHYPDMSMSPTDLLEEVVRAAADAGVMLKVKKPSPGPDAL